MKALSEPEEGNSMYPLGLHGDGVPVKGRKNQFILDYWTINFVGSRKNGHTRFLICCLDQQFSLGQETYQEIMKVITWSLKQLACGQRACRRHDGKKLDKDRQAKAGQSLEKAVVVQLRGDWDWHVKVHGAPNHNTNMGMCWLCKATPSTWKAQSLEERQAQSLQKADWLANLEERGKAASPFFQLANLSNKSMKPDWMRVMDEGIASSIAGQCIHEFQKYCPGRNKDLRTKELYKMIKSIYEKEGTAHSMRLQKLSVKDYQKAKKSPELEGKAAHIRGFCPYLHELANSLLPAEGTAHDRAVAKLAKFCSNVYRSLEKADLPRLERCGRLLKEQWMSLEKAAVSKDEHLHYHSRPKWHLFDHILDDIKFTSMNPKDTWCYKDETYGYTLQQYFTARGGKNNCQISAQRVLMSWMVNQAFPTLQQCSKTVSLQ